MKRYRFRLETVLHVREIQEEQTKGRVLAARAAEASAAAARQSHLASYAGFAPGSGVMAAAEALAAYEQHLRAAWAVVEADAAVARAAEVVTKRLEEWSAAAQRVQVLVRLDERRREEHAIEVRRDEDRTVDDIVSSAYVRRRR